MSDWEDLVLKGVEARKGIEGGQKAIEGGQWRLGDLAMTVETRPGEHSLERYAKQIDVTYSRLRCYKATAQAFPIAQRWAKLSYGHYEVLTSRDDRIDWLKKAEEGKWSVQKLLKAIHLADNPPRPKEHAKEILKEIQQDGNAEKVIVREVRKYGLTPAVANEVSRETSLMVPATDNRMYDGRPREVVEREGAKVQRQGHFVQALTHISNEMISPEDELREFPTYLEHHLEDDLEKATKWLNDFTTLWRERCNNTNNPKSVMR